MHGYDECDVRPLSGSAIAGGCTVGRVTPALGFPAERAEFGALQQEQLKRHRAALNAPETATRRTATSQLEELHKECERLHGAISQLENRLQFVLGSVPSNAGDQAMPPEQPSLVDVLRSLTRRVSAAASRVNELTERVEL